MTITKIASANANNGNPWKLKFSLDTQKSYLYISFLGFIIYMVLILTVQNYRVLWTGLGAQLARDVPFSAICWSTLEPVRYHLFEHFNGCSMISYRVLLLHICPTWCHFLLLLCADPKKNSWTGGWWSQCTLHPWNKLFCWFCCRNPCSCCYMSARCGKNPSADRGLFPTPILVNKVSLQTSLKKNSSNSFYFFLLDVKLKIYPLNYITHQISFKLDVIYYSINKLIFYT